jgi:hypothetical protein
MFGVSRGVDLMDGGLVEILCWNFLDGNSNRTADQQEDAENNKISKKGTDTEANRLQKTAKMPRKMNVRENDGQQEEQQKNCRVGPAP